MLRNLMRHVLRKPEDDGTTGGGAPTPATKTFPGEYVSELRAENAHYRKKAQEQQTMAETATAAAAKAKEEAEAVAAAKIAEATTAANARVIRTEMKALAREAGMLDMDFLQLADLSKVTLDDKGEVVGGKEVIEALKKAKPHMFKEASTSSTDPAPKPGEKKPFDARTATPAELAAWKREHGIRA